MASAGKRKRVSGDKVDDDDLTATLMNDDSWTPTAGDDVIGVVVRRIGELIPDLFYLVDIGSSQYAMLNVLAFDSATKKNRPQLRSGDLVYARIESAGLNVQPHLTCVNSYGWGKGWGPLEPANGAAMLAHTPPFFARRLLLKRSPESNMLFALGQRMRFEVAIGQNGLIWFRSASDFSQVQLLQFFMAAQAVRSDEEADALVREIADRCLSHAVTGVADAEEEAS